MTDTPDEIIETPDAAIVAAHNDAFRRHVCLGIPYEDGIPTLEGRFVCTAAVAGRGELFVDTCRRAIGYFSAFSSDDDPNGIHDFGAVKIAGVKVWWKIDAYDREFEYNSDDPSDPARTARVLTIMLPSDW